MRRRMNSASLIDWRAVMGPGLQCAFWAFAIAPQQTSGSQQLRRDCRKSSLNQRNGCGEQSNSIAQASTTRYPLLVARAERVRELLETARRRSDAKRPIRQKKAVDKLD